MAATRVALLGTGGTIASSHDERGQLVARSSVAELLARCDVPEGVVIDPVVDLTRINSWDMSPAAMWRLATSVREVLDQADVAGAVITHGTDTLEETSFALELALGSNRKPVVFAPAMRSADSSSADGPRNLSNALMAAGSTRLQGLGVTISSADELHAARWVRKVHTHHVQAFSSPGGAPVATFGPGKRLQMGHPALPTWAPDWHIDRNVHVAAISPYTGCDRRLLEVVVEHTGARGVVIEGFGVGNLPSQLRDGIATLTERGVVVVVASRVLVGGAYPIYGGAGGGAGLAGAGAIFAGMLSPSKARLLLMWCLSGAGETTARARMVHALNALDLMPGTPPSADAHRQPLRGRSHV